MCKAVKGLKLPLKTVQDQYEQSMVVKVYESATENDYNTQVSCWAIYFSNILIVGSSNSLTTKFSNLLSQNVVAAGMFL